MRYAIFERSAVDPTFETNDPKEARSVAMQIGRSLRVMDTIQNKEILVITADPAVPVVKLCRYTLMVVFHIGGGRRFWKRAFESNLLHEVVDQFKLLGIDGDYIVDVTTGLDVDPKVLIP